MTTVFQILLSMNSEGSFKYHQSQDVSKEIVHSTALSLDNLTTQLSHPRAPLHSIIGQVLIIRNQLLLLLTKSGLKDSSSSLNKIQVKQVYYRLEQTYRMAAIAFKRLGIFDEHIRNNRCADIVQKYYATSHTIYTDNYVATKYCKK